MSTFVLQREYALQMPSSYVDSERDEMEYVYERKVGKNCWNSTKWVGRYIDIIIIAVSVGMGAFSIYYAKKYIRSIMGKTVTRVIKNKLMGYVWSSVQDYLLVH